MLMPRVQGKTTNKLLRVLCNGGEASTRTGFSKWVSNCSTANRVVTPNAKPQKRQARTAALQPSNEGNADPAKKQRKGHPPKQPHNSAVNMQTEDAAPQHTIQQQQQRRATAGATQHEATDEPSPMQDGEAAPAVVPKKPTNAYMLFFNSWAAEKRAKARAEQSRPQTRAELTKLFSELRAVQGSPLANIPEEFINIPEDERKAYDTHMAALRAAGVEIPKGKRKPKT